MNWQKTRRLGIALRIGLLAWAITVVTVSIFVMGVIPEQKRTILQDLESKAAGVAVSVRDVAAGAVVNGDYAALVEHCLQFVKEDKSLDYLVITRNDGESWLHDKSSWHYAHRLPSPWHPETRARISGIGVVPEFNRRVFHYSEPFDYSGIQWGWVHVGLSLRAYDRDVASIYRRTGILALVCILVSLLASGLYARLLVRPILTLQSVVRRVARGDLSARAVIQTGDEIELLAGSFNAMAGSLHQRDNILGSVRFAAQQFLAAADWRAVADEVLRRIGSAAEISRAHVLENHAGADGLLLGGERFQYAAPGLTSSGDVPKLLDIPWHGGGLEAWAEALKQGRVVSASLIQLNPAQRTLLASRGIQSLILVPIRTESGWWGCLEFDDCARERTWTDAEVDSLRALADMLGAAIDRQRARDALVEAKQMLEERVRERTRELREQVAARDKAHAQLAQAQHELMRASREAGMAEVATGVLHNVGNVLTSVNVSTTLISDRLRRSEVSSLTRVRLLLREHQADMAAFLTTDPKGMLVPGFIIQLAECLEEEHAALKREQDQLARNVDHIKEIVAMQQSYAQVSGVLEQVSVAKLLDDAIQMHDAALTRHAITINRHYADVPPVMVDKHKVLQILVNLVHNAKYALDACRARDRRLTLSIRLDGGDHVLVTVADNGIGIPPENLTRIFSHGFTTRKDGHGFGLHSGANAAKEMGGQLTAFSEGLDQGAAFTLELPITHPRARH